MRGGEEREGEGREGEERRGKERRGEEGGESELIALLIECGPQSYLHSCKPFSLAKGMHPAKSWPPEEAPHYQRAAGSSAK